MLIFAALAWRLYKKSSLGRHGFSVSAVTGYNGTVAVYLDVNCQQRLASSRRDELSFS